MRRPQIQQLRACRSDVLENRHSVDFGRRRERKRLGLAGVATLGLGGGEVDGADLSPASPAMGLKELPSLLTLSAGERQRGKCDQADAGRNRRQS